MATTWTKEMRWGEIFRAAVILGIVEYDEPKSMFKVREMLRQRENQGLVKSRKTGTAQSSPAYYKAKRSR